MTPRLPLESRETAGGGEQEARVLAFKRRTVAPRRRRANRWLALVGPLVAALATVGVPLGLVLWVLVSTRFQLRQVEVDAGPMVPAAWVREALRPILGENLPALDLSLVATRLESHPWADSIEASKLLPDRLRVRVTERRPVALLRETGGLAFLDHRGVRIASFDASLAQGLEPLALVTAGTHEPSGVAMRRALELIARFEELDGTWTGGVSEIEILSEDDFRVFLGAIEFPVLVRPGTLALGLERLHDLLPQLRVRYDGVEEVDLRFDRRVVVRPRDGVGTKATKQPELEAAA